MAHHNMRESHSTGEVAAWGGRACRGQPLPWQRLGYFGGEQRPGRGARQTGGEEEGRAGRRADQAGRTAKTRCGKAGLRGWRGGGLTPLGAAVRPHLVLVPPGQRGSTQQVARQRQRGVQIGIGGQGAVVACRGGRGGAGVLRASSSGRGRPTTGGGGGGGPPAQRLQFSGAAPTISRVPQEQGAVKHLCVYDSGSAVWRQRASHLRGTAPWQQRPPPGPAPARSSRQAPPATARRPPAAAPETRPPAPRRPCRRRGGGRPAGRKKQERGRTWLVGRHSGGGDHARRSEKGTRVGRQRGGAK